ncbi:TonB-dependent receptor [Phenylobacterium sp.]|uniref:TonB-dependent receptor plug domain-containing protein n=1 Tax=Phenylobacterium sp. TaxID=1871053 RepID=UPI0025E869FB|nr:TonB-dependent receptor [Phenylobacterium sp.]
MLIASLLAQAAVAATPQAAPPQPGVTSYPAAFFAPYQSGNASEMVERIPGFTFDRGSGARGYESSAGNVLIDGQRPTTKTDDLEQVLRRIQASSVDRIEVIRGGAPGIDMQGKTVIANVVRKAGGGFKALISASNQSTYDDRQLPAGRVELSGTLGKTKWEASTLVGKGLDGGYGPGPSQRIDAQGHITPVRISQGEGDILNGQLTGGIETPVAGGKLRLNVRAYSDKYKGEETEDVMGAVPTTEHEVDLFYTDDREIGGNYTHALGPRASLEVVGLRQTHDVRLESLFTDRESSLFDLDRNSSETIARSVAKYRFGDRLSLEGGAETAINRQDSATRLSSDGAAVALPAANVQVEERRSEAFAKGTWRPATAWTVDASLRYEHTRITSAGDVMLGKTLQYLKPRVAVSWDARASTQVRLRLEREVGQLNFNDFVASGGLNTASGITAGNPDLNPQQAWVGEAAVEQRFWGSASVTVTYRHSELTDAVDRGPVFTATGVFDQPTNIGDGTKDELIVEYSLPLDRLGLKGAVLKGDATRRWSSVTDPTTRRKREISGLHPTDWNLNFTQDIPKWRFSYGVDMFGGWRERYYRFNLIEVDKLRTYVKPFAEWRPRPDLSLRIELPNVTARQLHKQYLSYPGPRSAGGAPSLDDRTYEPGRVFYFRLRKTFGG